MRERAYEKGLNIKTSGTQREFYENEHYNRYEATNYNVLEELCYDYFFDDNDSIVDFGCGKGRLNFFLSNRYNCSVTGIEMNKDLINEANRNKENYLMLHPNCKNKIEFICCLAQEYQINKADNKFYFFNPFSVQIFSSVVYNILDSFADEPRCLDIVMYYPTEEFLLFLENNTPFNLYKKIETSLYKNDLRDCFYVYRLEK